MSGKIPHLDERGRAAAHIWSKGLFGDKWTFEVLLVARLTDEPFTTTNLVDNLELHSSSLIQRSVQQLRLAGVFVSETGDGRSKPMRRAPGKIWDWIEETSSVFAGSGLRLLPRAGQK